MFDHKIDPELAVLLNGFAEYYRNKYPVKGYLKKQIHETPYVLISVSKLGKFGLLYQNPLRSDEIIEIFRGRLYVKYESGNYEESVKVLLKVLKEYLPEAYKVVMSRD